MTNEEFKAENRAFIMWCKENYGEHPIGQLLLAVELYEMCRQTSDAISWDVMRQVGDKTFTSDSFLSAAKLILS